MSDIAITGLAVHTLRVPVRSRRRQGYGDATPEAEVAVVRIDTDAGILLCPTHHRLMHLLRCLGLGAGLHVLCSDEHYGGTIDTTRVYPREVDPYMSPATGNRVVPARLKPRWEGACGQPSRRGRSAH